MVLICVKNGLSFLVYYVYLIYVYYLYFVYGDGESVICKYYNIFLNGYCVILIDVV